MIPNKVERDILRSGNFDETEMDIDGSSKAHVFNILRNYTYTDKIGSPVREYIANALDEHVKAGIADKPVEVTFPTTFANELRVRDYGAGLYPAVYRETCVNKVAAIDNNEIVTKVCGGKVVVSNWKGVCEVCGESKKNLIGGVRKFFADYGASDKRTTNELIGAFGIGCKSAFAYTDSFTVVSIKDGKKWTFNLYIDESEVGKLVMLTEAETDEPSGVEIIIPVKPQDVSTFVSRGLGLMKYFRTKPQIKGIANVPSFERPEAAVSGENWSYFGNNSGTVIIQGQIGYPLDIGKMGQVMYNSTATTVPAGYIHQWEYELLKSGLEIEMSIGDVDVTASREQLQMTDKTVSAIRKRLSEIRESIVDHVSEKFKSAKNLIEAKTAYYNFFQKGGSYGATLAKSIGKIRWNGMEVTDSTIHLDASKHKVIQYKRYNSNGEIKQVTFEKIQCSDELNLYHDDTDRKVVNYRRRANTLLNAGAKSVTILQTDDAKALLSETLIDVKNLPKYSKVVPTVLSIVRNAGTGIDVTKRVKHKLKVFELDWTKLSATVAVRGAKSDYWKTTDIEVDKQIYVPIDRFEPNGLFSNSLKVLRSQLYDLHLLGIDIANTKIYGVKAGQNTGQMVRLDTWAREQAKKVKNLAEEVAIIKDWQSGDLFNVEGIKHELLPKGSVAKQYCEQYHNAIKVMETNSHYTVPAKVRAKLNLAAMAEIATPNVGKLVELSETFKKQYPLIELIHTGYFSHHNTPIVEYITLLDEAREAQVGLLATASAA